MLHATVKVTFQSVHVQVKDSHTLQQNYDGDWSKNASNQDKTW